MLKCLEQNVEGFEKIQALIRGGESLTYKDLILEIDIDHFNGYEDLLPVLLVSTDDVVIERASNRLYLQLFGEKMKEIGGHQMVNRIGELLAEEKGRLERRKIRLKELQLQNKL